MMRHGPHNRAQPLPVTDTSALQRTLHMLHLLGTNALGVTSTELAPTIGAQSVRAIRNALKIIHPVLAQTHIDLEHIYQRRDNRNGPGSIWSAGPRLAQAQHRVSLEAECFESRGAPYVPPAATNGPSATFEALATEHQLVVTPAGLDEALEILDALDRGLIAWQTVTRRPPSSFVRLGEFWATEASDGSSSLPIPDGYGAHGIWTRGEHDTVGGQIPPFVRAPTREDSRLCVLLFRVHHFTRTVTLSTGKANSVADAYREIHRGSSLIPDPTETGWIPGGRAPFHAIGWVGMLEGSRSAGPAGTRIRNQYRATVETLAGRTTHVDFEGFRDSAEEEAHAACARKGHGCKLAEVKLAASQRNPLARAAARQLRLHRKGQRRKCYPS